MKKRIIFLAVTTGIIFILTFSVNAQHYHGNRDDNAGPSSNCHGKGNMKYSHHHDNNGRCCDDSRGVVAHHQHNNHNHGYVRPSYCAPRQVIVVRNTCRPTYCRPMPRCGTVRY